MKKHLLSFFAIASMLFAGSCSQEEVISQSTGDEVKVTFTTELRSDAQSRAVGDNTANIDKLVFAVYDENGYEIPALRRSTHPADNSPAIVLNSDGNKKTATIEVVLAKSQTYDFAFWAQDSGYDAYTFSPGSHTVNVNYNQLANQPAADAFFKGIKGYKVNGSFKMDVTLKRPFAQVNFLTTQDDINKAITAGFVPTKSKITIKNVANTLDVLTGEVYDIVNQDVTFGYAEWLSDETTEITGVEGEWKYLATAYFLADQTNSETKIDATMYVTGGTSTEIVLTASDIAAQRNYRTNIYGDLLTNNGQFNVTVDPSFDGDIEFTANEQLKFIAKNGGTVTLTEDIVLDAPLNVAADMVLNLNGKTISGDFIKNNGDAVVKNSATLTIVDGTIKSTSNNGAAAIWNTGNLVLNGVKIVGAPIADGSYPEYTVYNDGGTLVVEEGTEIIADRGAIRLENGADVTINGGNFKVTDALGTRVLTAHVIYAYGSASKLTINNGNFTMDYAPSGDTGASVICPAGATIKVYGGNFIYSGPKGGQGGCFQNYMGYGKTVDVYGGTYNDATVNINLAEGYVASSNGDGTYTVTVGVKLDNISDLSTVLNNADPGSTIVLPANITAPITVGEMKDVIIDAADNTKVRFVTDANSKIENVTIKNLAFEFQTGSSQTGGACVVIDPNAEIDNLVIENSTFVGDNNKNSYGIFGSNSDATLELKNCTFKDLGYVVQRTSNAGSAYKSLIIEGCTFDNIKSWAILPQYGYNGDMTITGCTFKNSNGGLVKTGTFTGNFTFTNNTITNCTGHDGSDAKWFEVNASTATTVISGNTKDGSAWTPGADQGLK